MVAGSLLMETKFGKNEDVEEVELELCLSLGGPFKKTEKSKPVEQFNAVGCTKDTAGVNLEGGATMNVRSRKETRKKREPKLQQRSGVCKKIRTECNGVPNGVDLDLSFSKMGNGYMSSQLKETSKDVTIWSPICTSSDVSDPSSSSRQEGGSCDFGAQSDQTKPVRPPVNNMQSKTEDPVHSTDGSKDAVVVETTQEWSNSVTKNNTGKPPKPYTNSNGDGSMLPFAQMPCVTSTGNGPDGKTVNGFLYRYSKSEISIICVCHGTSFSPAEFIVHAGGTNVSHPLRHITVVPSTF